MVQPRPFGRLAPPSRSSSVSGDGWATPYLAILMQDEYDAVRYIAHRSLNQIGGYDDISYDFTAAPTENPTGPAAVMMRWNALAKDASFRPELLIAPGGKLDSRVGNLLQNRNAVDLFLKE